jgi:hypothetical protein
VGRSLPIFLPAWFYEWPDDLSGGHHWKSREAVIATPRMLLVAPELHQHIQKKNADPASERHNQDCCQSLLSFGTPTRQKIQLEG